MTRVLHIKEARRLREGTWTRRREDGVSTIRVCSKRGEETMCFETKHRHGSRKGGGRERELKGEKRSLKSCEPLTFVIEFSPSAISVLFARLTTSSLCFSSSLPTFFLFSVCTSILSLPPSFLPLKNRILTVLVVSLSYMSCWYIPGKLVEELILREVNYNNIEKFVDAWKFRFDLIHIKLKVNLYSTPSSFYFTLSIFYLFSSHIFYKST